MVTRRDADPDTRLRKTARGWAEPSPSHCSNCGSALGPMKVLVGVASCRSCGSHRTHFCRACESTQYTPLIGEQCLLMALDERNMRALIEADDDDQAPT